MLINNLVETHCHILPKVDDGAHDTETSLKMINRLKRQGAKAIILTPHYYSDSISYDDFIRRRNGSYNHLKEALGDDDIRLIPAAEVYISDYLTFIYHVANVYKNICNFSALIRQSGN